MDLKSLDAKVLKRLARKDDIDAAAIRDFVSKIRQARNIIDQVNSASLRVHGDQDLSRKGGQVSQAIEAYVDAMQDLL